MKRGFPVRQADQLMDEEFTAKWRDRQALDPLPREVLGGILAELIASGAPVTVEAIASRLPGRERADLEAAVRILDEKDMVLLEDGEIKLAYPFAAAPTPFAVRLEDGRERYAVCAIDALGVAPMLGQRVTIRASCYHCREPLELPVAPDGPVDGRDVMVWVGERGELRKKAFSSL